MNYDNGPPLIFDGDTTDCLAPIVRQHRRLAALASRLDAAGWSTPSRCDGWTTRDVIAHLVGVNDFWVASINAGLAGQPSRFLARFDPAKTPPLLVHTMDTLTNQDVLDRFVAGSETLLAILAGLDSNGWAAVAESPPGHVPIRLVVHHALWDSWVHERDIAVPLGLQVDEMPDELAMGLRYVAALSPTLGLAYGLRSPGRFEVEATNPNMRFRLDVGDTIVLSHDVAPPNAACLRGNTVELIEALSLRAPLPADTPTRWIELLSGLRTAFDAVGQADTNDTKRG